MIQMMRKDLDGEGVFKLRWQPCKGREGHWEQQQGGPEEGVHLAHPRSRRVGVPGTG